MSYVKNRTRPAPLRAIPSGSPRGGQVAPMMAIGAYTGGQTPPVRSYGPMGAYNGGQTPPVQRYGAMGDLPCDWFGIGCPAPDLTNLPSSPETPPATDTQTTTMTEGGQASPIPSSQPGGVTYTTSSTGNWATGGGVCKPTNSDYLGYFKELQRQLNRVADYYGWTKIGVDGAIGSQTLAMMAQLKGALAQYKSTTYGWVNFLANQNISSCDAVAASVIAITTMVQQMADSLGASSSVASPAPASPPQIVNPATGLASNQGMANSVGDLFKNLSTTQQVIAGGLVLAIGYVAVKQHDKKAAKRASSRTTRRY